MIPGMNNKSFSDTLSRLTGGGVNNLIINILYSRLDGVNTSSDLLYPSVIKTNTINQKIL